MGCWAQKILIFPTDISQKGTELKSSHPINNTVGLSQCSSVCSHHTKLIKVKSSLVFGFSLRSSCSGFQIAIVIQTDCPFIVLVNATAVSVFPGGYRIYVRQSRYDTINWKPYILDSCTNFVLPYYSASFTCSIRSSGN